MSRFKINQTTISGTAAQYSVFEGNLFKAQEWQKTIDCDFLLSIELDVWPESAQGWITLRRNWPSQEESIYL